MDDQKRNIFDIENRNSRKKYIVLEIFEKTNLKLLHLQKNIKIQAAVVICDR